MSMGAIPPNGATRSDNPKNIAARARVKLSLLPAAGVIHGAHACMHGAEEYGPYNWREKKIALMEYASAAERHIKAWIDGEDCSRDHGVHHFGHAIASLAIALDAMELGMCIDDRPSGGPASDIMLRVREKEERWGREREREMTEKGEPPSVWDMPEPPALGTWRPQAATEEELRKISDEEQAPGSPHFDTCRIDPRKVNMRRT